MKIAKPMLARYDPFGYGAMYVDHPMDERSPIYQRTDGLSAQCFDWLAAMRRMWGGWVPTFLRVSLVHGESDEMFDSIADDQGDFASSDDRAQYCGWFPGWRG
ncbi:hypothetical protein [Burkholderia anthina]|uniref:Uncharacterized protein n=1 Tax=Burkholderia anthina TaxID=179879 RepID=A0A6P2GJP2_9BURK|nr:hypothetical protein [Burkholderia anthina]MBM2765236.1 hypothetical protein [Burkholderia anthina]VVU53514.1 hypothetical protein BAN20980_06194 [Burkholderia anthina]